ncbi:GGDEF domain-containing protein [Allocoprobacillus halotolerans]|uniref:GGDEF domain-containing protein n=1 Tax=Allocoprobacillus halotolerans TaxID=2944914 RepID=A0ABY5I4X6_9FIRM|nr:GGDEF domain-containing protein [Allocoprobacillus halotolerans]UTY39832.1 GGDEF domain-containing protein [Allocoprobacillus halotolerans]
MIFVIIMALVIVLLVFGYRVTLKTNHELTHFAYYDNLTGAYNFSYFTAYGKEKLKNRQACSVAVLNIRQFKFYNEIFGHDQGNRLLIYIKKVIEKNLKEDEFFAMILQISSIFS